MSQDPSTSPTAPEAASLAPTTAAAPAPAPAAVDLSRMRPAQRSAFLMALSPEDLSMVYKTAHVKAVEGINKDKFVPQKMVLVVRTDIPMSAGKRMAQCAHAAVGSFSRALGIDEEDDGTPIVENLSLLEGEEDEDEDEDASAAASASDAAAATPAAGEDDAAAPADTCPAPVASALDKKDEKKTAHAPAAAAAPTFAASASDRKLFTTHWRETGAKKIAVKGKWDDVKAAAERARAWGVASYLVYDAGHTQLDPGTATVLAVGPAPELVVDMIVGHLSLM